MQDRFKFRVWSIRDKRYIYDAVFAYDGNSFWGGNFNGDNPGHICCFGEYLALEDKYIVEQCTGLKDKNGKLVYEGDWLKTKDGYYCYVVWFEGFWWVKSLPSEAMDFEHSEFYGECEVVGNIRENPDFMEKE